MAIAFSASVYARVNGSLFVFFHFRLDEVAPTDGSLVVGAAVVGNRFGAPIEKYRLKF